MYDEELFYPADSTGGLNLATAEQLNTPATPDIDLSPASKIELGEGLIQPPMVAQLKKGIEHSISAPQLLISECANEEEAIEKCGEEKSEPKPKAASLDYEQIQSQVICPIIF